MKNLGRNGYTMGQSTLIVLSFPTKNGYQMNDTTNDDEMNDTANDDAMLYLDEQ